MSSITGMPYVYKPFRGRRSIRVITLYPSLTHEAPLHITFSEVELSAARGKYEAVSYTWGEPRLICPLYLSCEVEAEAAPYILVTTNLDKVLRRLRRSEKPRKLWADAICINQSDNSEKAIQIQLMVTIFEAARRVLACISFEAGDEVCLQKLQHWNKSNLSAVSQSLCDNKLSREREIDRLRREMQESSWVILPDPTTLRRAARILQLRWFTRLWIIQEVVFNPEVILICGGLEVTWIRFTNAVYCLKQYLDLYDKDDSAFQSAHEILIIARLRDYHCGPSTSAAMLRIPALEDLGIINLLWEFQDYDCTDDRDRIYALVSMARDVLPADDLFLTNYIHLKVDYSLDVRQVYENFALACMKAEKTARQMLSGPGSRISSENTDDILNHTLARQLSCTSDDWPSWIPDWRHTPLCADYVITRQIDFERALPDHGIEVTLKGYWGHLTQEEYRGIAGHYPAVRTVLYIGNSQHGSLSFQNLLGILATALLPSSVWTPQALTVLLTGWWTWPIRAELLCEYLAVKYWHRKPSRSELKQSELTAILEDLKDLTTYGRLFTAVEGEFTFLGFGNHAIKEGDKLCSYDYNASKIRELYPDTCRGTNSTLILRPVTKTDVSKNDEEIESHNPNYHSRNKVGYVHDRCRLIGSAYVLGPFVGGKLMECSEEEKEREYRTRLYIV